MCSSAEVGAEFGRGVASTAVESGVTLLCWTVPVFGCFWPNSAAVLKRCFGTGAAGVEVKALVDEVSGDGDSMSIDGGTSESSIVCWPLALMVYEFLRRGSSLGGSSVVAIEKMIIRLLGVNECARNQLDLTSE